MIRNRILFTVILLTIGGLVLWILVQVMFNGLEDKMKYEHGKLYIWLMMMLMATLTQTGYIVRTIKLIKLQKHQKQKNTVKY